MLFQTPIPSDFWTWLFGHQAWNDFPVVFMIVACFILAAFAARMFWLDFRREAERVRLAGEAAAEKDRAWREVQNDKRESAQDARDKQWRDIISSQYATLEKISSSMLSLSSELREHDEQAREIKTKVDEINQNTRPKRKPL